MFINWDWETRFFFLIKAALTEPDVRQKKASKLLRFSKILLRSTVYPLCVFSCICLICAACAVKSVHFLKCLCFSCGSNLSAGIKHEYMKADIQTLRHILFPAPYPQRNIVKLMWDKCRKEVPPFFFIASFLTLFCSLFCSGTIPHDTCSAAVRQWFPARGTRTPEDTCAVAKGYVKRLKRSSAYLCEAYILLLSQL